MFKLTADKVLIFLIYISVFINSYVFTKEPVEIYFGYIAFLILLPVFILRHPFPKHFIAIFSVLLLAGLLNIYFDNDTFPLFIKIFIGLFLSYLFYYYVVVQFDYNVEKLFQWYLKGCYIVGIIGIIQLISFHIGFKPGYDLHWIGFNKWGVNYGGNLGIRINSVFGEPTYYATCVSAGVFVAMYNIIVKKPYYLSRIQSLVVLLPYVLSFSGVAFTAIFIAIIVLLLNFGFIRYLFVFILIFWGMFTYLYNNVRDFRERYDSTIEVFSTDEFSVGKTHGSSIILYDNYQVAMKNFSNNFLFGTGLGSHPIAFSRYSKAQYIEIAGFAQNYKDASSMFSRLLSETGLFGTGLMILIFFKCFVKKMRNDTTPDHFWIISGAICVMIAVNLIRQGNYYLNGFPFFIWMYYYNKINFKKFLIIKNTIKEN